MKITKKGHYDPPIKVKSYKIKSLSCKRCLTEFDYLRADIQWYMAYEGLCSAVICPTCKLEIRTYDAEEDREERIKEHPLGWGCFLIIVAVISLLAYSIIYF